MDVFLCKPLACAYPASAFITITRSPTAKPDPAALDRFAKEAVPANIHARDVTNASFSASNTHLETLSSEHTKVRGYEAVRWDVRQTNATKTEYVANTLVFVGGLLLKVEARSDTREHAHATLSTIVEATDFEYQPLS
jgi:hypothetical protein